MRGTVTRVFTGKGYGFIRGEDGVSRFFNAADVEPKRDFDLLCEDRGVDFDSTEGDPAKGNGLKAVKVRLR